MMSRFTIHFLQFAKGTRMKIVGMQGIEFFHALWLWLLLVRLWGGLGSLAISVQLRPKALHSMMTAQEKGAMLIS